MPADLSYQIFLAKGTRFPGHIQYSLTRLHFKIEQ